MSFAEIMKLPYVGSVQHGDITFTVIGTSHFKCNSAAEVSALIEIIQPDGVVLELDPERVLKLTKESGRKPWFGADFLAAIETSKEMDIPLFVGDEYMKETQNRFLKSFFSLDSYNPKALYNFLLQKNSQINIIQAFIDDPMKALPLFVAFVFPTLFLSLIFDDNAGALIDSELIPMIVNTLFSILGSFLGASKVFNTLISDRDEILVRSAKQAADILLSLRSRQTIRKTWVFLENPQSSGDRIPGSKTAIPLFTLKRPLEKDSIRSLNLFEPRWLSMIDTLNTNEILSFGCLTCLNKFYCATKICGKDARYADIIFQRSGRIALIQKNIEGARPSGDRKVILEIKGAESFIVQEDEVVAIDNGYLIISPDRVDSTSIERKCSNDSSLSIVIVVGLLHASGIVKKLADR